MSAPKRTCSVEGCERSHYSRGWCQLHYNRWQRHGDPLGDLRRGPEERFRADAIPGDGSDDCWRWTGRVDRRGYGRMGIGQRDVFAHRFAYELLVGPVPEGLCILHRCDNPPCCNPNHLFAGTKADNHADMVAKGRGTNGERHGNAKLTMAQVQEIRQATGITQRALAQRYGVSQVTIQRIRAGTRWTRAPLPPLRKARMA